MSAVSRRSSVGQPVIMLAGGGTGGHVFPLVAVADALREAADVRVVYVGTARGLEVRTIPARGDELELLAVAPIKGRGAGGAVRGLAQAAAALPAARSLVKRLAPKAVLSAGGYVAGPVGLAAWSRRVPLAILEPNSILGMANRWLLPFAKRAYVAYTDSEREIGPRAQRTGVPLRGQFHAASYRTNTRRLRVLVVGGSQGATALNLMVPRALAHAEAQLKEAGSSDRSDQLEELEIVHQAGRDRDGEVRQAYASLGQAATVLPFIDDMAGELARADLVIARAGACCLAELCSVGRPSILIPFPFAADDHQKKNGDALAAEGAAICLAQSDATPARVAAEVMALARDPARRAEMAARAAAQGRPGAASEIARDLLTLAAVPLRGMSAASHPKASAHV
jgi:UDP-N-acetylglucosamine--N-acetylmuramyl-(pentapeptide) pyrophosphoryl-undecaprenol N-acetylglucosamine transferase